MYSRQKDASGDLRVPRNYSGNVIFSPPRADIPTKQHAPRDLPPRQRGAERDATEISDRQDNAAEPAAQAAVEQRKTPDEPTKSPLSPLSSIGTEELLLIALALIVFQGGKEPELALLLLALLFIS